jgi:hypothetical protein
MFRDAGGERRGPGLGVQRYLGDLLRRFDQQVPGACDWAVVTATEEESEELCPRRPTSLAVDPIEHGLDNEDLSQPTMVRLDRCQDIMGVAERFPEDRTADRHRALPDACAGPGRGPHCGSVVHSVRHGPDSSL